MIFFDIVKKYMIFVQKLIAENMFKIQKKFLHNEKVQKLRDEGNFFAPNCK